MRYRLNRPVRLLAVASVTGLLLPVSQSATAQDHQAGRPAGHHAAHVTAAAQSPAAGRPIVFPAELEFRNQMRKLWEDHVVWTRMAIVSFLADLPDFGPAAERLLRNQADIGDAFEPFYGRDAADQLTDLLRDHILIAVDVLAAAKAGDQAALDDALSRWDANAVDIATFLNGLNPDNWRLDEMTAMMREHLALTTQEAVARLNGDFAADVAAYDTVHDQILEMADMLSTGVIAQFPQHFRPGRG
ncbi:MAG: hypothetical protein FWJ70_14120 [Micromonosporaceae bacterium]